MKIGYQGIKGAYSEAALYKYFGNDVQAIGFENFYDVFKALENEEIKYAFLPFENTIAGSVVMNYDLLLKSPAKIIGEEYLKINHCLLAPKGSSLKDITRVYSHPHSLAQCQKFINENSLKPVPDYDTAGSAKLVKQRDKKDEAAIASKLCAEIYGMDILKEGIETNQNNITKFFVICRDDENHDEIKKEKTSIAFKTKHYPGALVNCLQRLSKNNINLTKLESRPNPQNAWEYVFYADFLGGTDDAEVKLALSEMEASALFIKVLGSYGVKK